MTWCHIRLGSMGLDKYILGFKSLNNSDSVVVSVTIDFHGIAFLPVLCLFYVCLFAFDLGCFMGFLLCFWTFFRIVFLLDSWSTKAEEPSLSNR